MTTHTTTVSTEATGQSAEEQARLVALADGSEAPAGNEGESLILGKFKTQDDLVKAYSELEKKLGGNRPAESEAPAETPKADPPKLEVGDDDSAQAAVENAGLDFNKYSASWLENGSLTDDDYAELESKGFDRATVDVYTDGLRFRQEQAQNAAYDAVGGVENYRSMASWAAANLSATDKATFNESLKDAAKRGDAITGLYARFTEAVGNDGNLITGKTTAPTTGGYASWGEVTAAMNDKRYGKDPAYTREVQTKVGLSQL